MRFSIIFNNDGNNLQCLFFIFCMCFVWQNTKKSINIKQWWWLRLIEKNGLNQWIWLNWMNENKPKKILVIIIIVKKHGRASFIHMKNIHNPLTHALFILISFTAIIVRQAEMIIFFTNLEKKILLENEEENKQI